jgi:tartrate-resistant acid phosphatase type 5
LVVCASLGASCAFGQDYVRFAVIGDYGMASQPEADVSTLVHGWNPQFVITTGDNNYPSGASATIDANIGQYYQDFIAPYTGSYGPGAAVNAFFPCLGNQDYDTAGAIPYLNYFSLPNNERYYTLVKGPVEFFCISSDPREPDGTTSASTQGVWIQSRMASSTAVWKIPFFHHPPYTSGSHGNSVWMQWPFGAWGASLVLCGHDHIYERLNVGGLTFVTNGLGGTTKGSIQTPAAGSVLRYNNDFGAMLVEASADALRSRFVSRAGTTIDSFLLTAPGVALPTNYSLLRGVTLSGALSDLYFSDDSPLVTRPGAVFTTSELPIQVVIDGTSPFASPSQLRFQIEASGTAVGLVQSIYLFNYSSNGYDLVDTRTATLFDSPVEVVVDNLVQDYVSGTRAVRAKVSWKATAAVFTFPWKGRLDLALWRISP